jgi:hypothetical protein
MRRAWPVLLVTGLVSRSEADPGHAESAIRAGVNTGSVASDGSDGHPTGSGPFVEVEGGWRSNERMSFGGFIAYSSFADTIATPLGMDRVHMRFLDVGLRVNGHYGGLFGGAGAGLENVYPSGYLGNRDQLQPIVDLHAGFTFPAIHGIAPQLTGTVTYTFQDSAEIYSARIAIGVQL